jgi:acetolactate synthase-1/3 small subunit
VGSTEQGMARMTITVAGDESTVEQLVKQMAKLVDIIKVSTLEPGNSVVRELALIKVHIPSTTARSDVIQYANIFRGRVVDVSPESLIIEVTGTSDKINAFIELMRSFGVMELARTGITALARGPKMIKVK